MPYKLPSIMSGNEGIKSVCVYYPDIPEFKSALLGALTFFTKWTAWERDENNSALVAAELWYRAYEETIKTWAESCGGCDDMPTLDDIRDIIQQELENMTINNCVTVNCGCCGGSGDSGIDTMPPIDYEPPTVPPLDEPDQPTPSTDYMSYRCNAAHYLYYKFSRIGVLQLADFGNNSGLSYENVSSILNSLQSPIAVVASVLWEVYYTVVEWLTARVNEGGSVIVQETDKSYDMFVCAAFGADGVNDAAERWNAVIDGLSLNWATRYYLKLLSQNIEWENWLYPDNWETIEFPASYTDRDCSACESNSFPSPIPGADAFLDSVQGTGDTWSGELFADGEKIVYGVPYRLTSVYLDVSGQVVDAWRVFWRANDGQGGRVDLQVRVTNVQGWQPRPNDYVDSMRYIAADDTVTYEQGDTVPIVENELYSPVWQGQLLGSSESADTQTQYPAFTCEVTFYEVD